MGDKLKVGIVFGCFIPLHSGHIDMIGKCLTENDRTIIAVTGYDQDRGSNFIPFQRRLRLMKQIYKKEPNAAVVEVDDKKLGLTGTFSKEAWGIWCRELFANVGINPFYERTRYTWYTGEQSYIDKIKEIYPCHSFCLLDRDRDTLSGTLIRKDPEKYESRIHPAFWEYLTQNKIIQERRQKNWKDGLSDRLSCKTGDTVYCPDENIGCVFPVRISDIIISETGPGKYSIQYNGAFYNADDGAKQEFEFNEDDFGKHVFFEKEKAEAILKAIT